MSLPGPSSLGRVAACPTSEALPHARSSNLFTKRGDVVHKFLADCAQVGRDVALLSADPEHVDALEIIPFDRLPPLEAHRYAVEVSFALNIATGDARELGRELERDAARAMAKPGEMVGTADLVGLTVESVVIHDWKSGRGHVDRADVNWQTKTYALAAARTYGRDRAIGSIIRVLDDGTVWYDYFDMDALDLDAHEAALRALMAERDRVLALAPEDRPALHEGEHCRYCPALRFCPAKQVLLQAVVADDKPLSLEVVELTPERAAAAWAKLQRAEQLIELLKATVKDFARQTPVPTGDGFVLEEIEESKETIVPGRAVHALVKHFGDQMGGVVYGESVEQKTTLTKTKLKAALSKFVLPTLPKEKAKLAPVERETLEVLRKNGAVSVSSYRHVKEHKVKEEKKKALPAGEEAEVAA
jgi:hypothetical protein